MIKRHLLDKGLIALSPKGLWSGSVSELIAAASAMAAAHNIALLPHPSPAASPQPG
ncbi:hypothetical protein [Bradyrhizobium murdochi]|uniref:hypothetical protein n=1 Tax=Bradyrhizobium murdochi TaxID=1038859 RepID=UPI000408F549|nr:hypothetical protein [Bradyrhizobium murdochi]